MRKTDHDIGDPRNRVETEAADWWSRLELGTADREAFERWREASAAHAIAFARVQASWEALAEQDSSIGTHGASGAVLTRRNFLRAGGLGAACLMAGSAFYTSRALAWDSATTGVGEFRRITLPDASMLELNTDTTVSWHFTKHVRKIRLEQGEIAMALTSGAPTTLLTHEAKLALSPGRFNARLVGGKIGLTVLTGRAILEQESPLAPLPPVKAGEAAELTPAGMTVQATTTERRALITAWQSGDIVFQDEPLQAAVEEYNRYLTTKISVDPALGERRVGGRFTTSDPSEFLRSVSLALDTDIRTSPGTIQIVARK